MDHIVCSKCTPDKKLQKLKAVTGMVMELTVTGFGSRMRFISFLDPEEKHDGNVKSALHI